MAFDWLTLPSIWALITPNFDNVFVWVGIILLIAGVLGFTILKIVMDALAVLVNVIFKTQLNGASIASLLSLVGIFLTWGVSILMDYLASTGFWIIIMVVVIIVLVLVLILKNGKHVEEMF